MSDHKDILEVTVAELLTEDRDDEILRREGEWDAFTAQVFRQMDVEELEVARADLEDQAIELFKEEIDLELSDMAPLFEESFRESVEKQIFKSAMEPAWTTRVKAWFEERRSEIGLSLSWATAATAMAAMVIAVAPFDQRTANVEDQLANGQVSVERISFEGDVTVLPDDGVTIIWLDEHAG